MNSGERGLQVCGIVCLCVCGCDRVSSGKMCVGMCETRWLVVGGVGWW